MPYRRLRITKALVTTSVGRRELLARAGDRVGPSLCALAGLYRKIVIRRTRVVAVVGSFGKTTTARAVISSLGLPSRHIGLNSVAWVALALLRIRPGQRHAVIEVGINGPGQMIKHARTVLPDIAVVTSVGSEHNRSLKSLEITRNEKAEMVRILPSSGAAVLNGDDPNVLWMAGETRARVVTFGFGDTNDVRATDLALDWPHGTRFTLHTPIGTCSVRVRLIGRPMVCAAGHSFRNAVEALEPDLEAGDVVLIKGRDSQRLERVALTLMGRQVGCDLVFCDAKLTRCDECPMLERG